ncbi:MAG: UDP-N-acetylmuramoyl-L-alanine--D-glutamate ligase, partial [Desulfobacterales bacterium]|nr:UDP-N-acetylmuramoyl-L-alanine--D-glutamate ligase [Desulfobacterales bacterium]
SSVSLPCDASVFRYGLEAEENRNAFIEGQKAKVCMDGRENSYFSLESYSLPGRHNIENLLATVLAGKILGAGDNAIQRTLDEFKGLPNRLENVGEINGVAFYNDSKATNVDSAVRAVLSFDRPIILIAGGRHKGADYSPLIEAAQGRVKKTIFLGEAKELLALSFKGIIPFSMAEDMEEAVSISFSEAKKGDMILLAPACSSFDMFLDYSHRGSVFASSVRRLIDNG